MQQKTIIRLAACQAKTGVSRSFIYDCVKKGTFPRPISIGVRAVGWIESEIDDWIESRINASRGVAK